MNRLWIQLSLAFALVILVCTLTIGLVTNRWAEAIFRGYLVQTQISESGLPSRLSDYYAAQGSWEGAAALLSAVPGHGTMGGMGRGPGGMLASSLVLADQTGRIVADPHHVTNGSYLSRSQRTAAVLVQVETQTVGYLLVQDTRSSALPVAAQRFLTTLNQTLWVAGGLAALVALVVGLIFSRSLAAPLQRLAHSSRQIASGALETRVAPAGPTELRMLATAFNEMAHALEAGESQRRTMVADIAHELRTPLSVIQGNLQALLDEVYPLTKSEIATIHTASLGLGRLVDDLRELSLAEAGRLPLRREPLDLAALCAHEVAIFAEAAASRQVPIALHAPAGLPLVSADLDRTRQILHNLLSNALRYTPPAGQIQIGLQAGPGVVICTVHDTGSGIDPADLPHVFERFYRADRGRARDTGGSGLGLAIVRQIVLLHGGQIGVQSTPGSGSSFWFSLPNIAEHCE
jgi:two-component system OmpR family sensor kinase/two-component system sensor histidine kinase BaeS